MTTLKPSLKEALMEGKLSLTAIQKLAQNDRDAIVERLLDLDIKDEIWPWLTRGKQKHFAGGVDAHSRAYHGRRLRRADFNYARVRVARKRAIRLALAVAILAEVGPGAVLKATWADVRLDEERWTIPLADFIPARRPPQHKRGARDPATKDMKIPKGGQIHRLFRQARGICHGVALLCTLAPAVKDEFTKNGGRCYVPESVRLKELRPGELRPEEPVFASPSLKSYHARGNALRPDALRDFLRKTYAAYCARDARLSGS